MLLVIKLSAAYYYSFSFLLFTISALALSSWTAHACSCSNIPTLLRAFANTNGGGAGFVVIKAKLLQQLNTSTTTSLDGEEMGDNVFPAQLQSVWKGCNSLRYYRVGGASSTALINITTPANVGFCGISDLEVGRTYLLVGRLEAVSRVLVQVDICLFHKEWNKVTSKERNQLEGLSKNYSTICTSALCAATPELSCGPLPTNSSYSNPRPCPDGFRVATGALNRTCTYNPRLRICDWSRVRCKAISTTSCQKQSDCHKGRYCSAGKCRTIGACRSDIDCWNPQNTFKTTDNNNCTTASLPRCSSKTNKCYLNCSSSANCSTTACLADPCLVKTCNAANISCIRNYCGGCQTIFINSSGYQVCNK